MLKETGNFGSNNWIINIFPIQSFIVQCLCCNSSHSLDFINSLLASIRLNALFKTVELRAVQIRLCFLANAANFGAGGSQSVEVKIVDTDVIDAVCCCGWHDYKSDKYKNFVWKKKRWENLRFSTWDLMDIQRY